MSSLPGRKPATGFELDAIVLAGGRASRLGGASKPALTSDGVPLLHLALDAAGTARRIAVVGPDALRGTIDTHPAAARTILTREDPPFGGPVAGITAGLAALTADPNRKSAPTATTGWALLLAVDTPRAANAVPHLLHAVRAAHPLEHRGERPALNQQGPPAETRKTRPDSIDGAHLVADGRAQWLVGMYRTMALAERIRVVADRDRAGRGVSVRTLMDGLHLLDVPDPGSLSADVDTWDDAERLGIRQPHTPRSTP